MAFSPSFRSGSASAGLRGFVNRHPVPICAAVIAIAAVCIYRALHSGPIPNQGYYTVDDGATWFAQDVRVPPFDHDGKEAVGAMIYSCDGGKTRFVGYLYRYTPEGKTKMEELIKQHRGGPPIGLEVKRPGTGTWTPAVNHGPPADGADGPSITNVKCPEGNGAPFMVNP